MKNKASETTDGTVPAFFSVAHGAPAEISRENVLCDERDVAVAFVARIRKDLGDERDAAVVLAANLRKELRDERDAAAVLAANLRKKLGDERDAAAVLAANLRKGLGDERDAAVELAANLSKELGDERDAAVELAANLSKELEGERDAAVALAVNLSEGEPACKYNIAANAMGNHCAASLQNGVRESMFPRDVTRIQMKNFARQLIADTRRHVKDETASQKSQKSQKVLISHRQASGPEDLWGREMTWIELKDTTNRALTLDKLLYLCGDKEADLGNRVAEVLQHGITPAMYKTLSDRMNYTDGVTLEEAIIELSGNGPSQTLRDYFTGPFFTSPVKAAQDPRFPGSLKDWSNLADYLWPPAIRSWQLRGCYNLVTHIAETLTRLGDVAGDDRTSIKGIPYVHEFYMNELITAYRDPAFMLRLFASGDKGRGSPPHRNGFPSHSVMLVIKGGRRVVIFPRDQEDKLYPLGPDQIGAAENNETNVVFMANAFDVNLTRQPALQDVVGGLEGQVDAGDLLYTPCGVVSTGEAVGELIALAWVRTEKNRCPT